MSTSVNKTHPLKAYSPIVMKWLKSISFKEAQSSKAWSPILVSVGGQSTEISFVQPEKTPSAMASVPGGKSIDNRFLFLQRQTIPFSMTIKSFSNIDNKVSDLLWEYGTIKY